MHDVTNLLLLFRYYYQSKQLGGETPQVVSLKKNRQLPTWGRAPSPPPGLSATGYSGIQWAVLWAILR